MAASFAFAGVALVLAWSKSFPLVFAALLVAGYCWIAINSSMNASAQAVLPDWVRSRGMSIYLLVFQGAQAVGAVIWGIMASRWGTPVALSVVAGGLAGGVPLARRWPLVTRPIDVRPSQLAPEPELALELEPTHGPVLITVDYRVPVENADAFRDAMERVGRSHRRTGAERWGLYRDGIDPERFLEAYVVPTWEEHLRQHQERYTRSDALYREEAHKLLKPGTAPKVDHLLFAYDR
jgi:hypothetical protein